MQHVISDAYTLISLILFSVTVLLLFLLLHNRLDGVEDIDLIISGLLSSASFPCLKLTCARNIYIWLPYLLILNAYDIFSFRFGYRSVGMRREDFIPKRILYKTGRIEV